MKKEEVALGVRVKLNSQFVEKCLGDKFLKCEPVLFIFDKSVYFDNKGDYVLIKGGSLVNSGYAYLNELDCEYPIPNKPLYLHEEINYNE